LFGTVDDTGVATDGDAVGVGKLEAAQTPQNA